MEEYRDGGSAPVRRSTGFAKGLVAGLLIAMLMGVIGLGAAGVLLVSTGKAAQIMRVFAVPSVQEGLDRDKINSKLDELESMVDYYYLFEDRIDREQMEAGIYKGYMSGLNDIYSGYYTAKEWQELAEDLEGSYVGVGAMLQKDMETGVVTIVRVFAGSPAEEAGMLPGDMIYKVGDIDASTEDLDVLVSKYIRGEEGTRVQMTVYRSQTDEFVDLDIERRKVSVETVTAKLNGEIGLVTVLQFDMVTGNQFISAIESLKEAGMKKLIIDLRDNPGGELTTCEKMADYILEDGRTIVSIKDKYGEGEVCSSEDGKKQDMPIVVLVNGNSASAAEVLTGALKDNGAATVVGTQTFGKGIVQSVFTLSDGSAVKITTDHYYTPNGTDIHEHGITPDVVVEPTEEEKSMVVIPEDQDTQLQKALEILR